jgi:hypothetical protein
MANEANIVSIIVGGAIALAGTIVSQTLGLLSGWVDRRHQRDIRQRERLEQLASAVSATILWFQTLSSCRTIEEIRANPPPLEARRISILALLYFPRLLEPAAAYTNGLIRYYHFCIDCFSPHAPATLGAQVARFVSNHPEAKQREDEPLFLRNHLDEAIAQEAKRYSHA